MRYKLQFSVFSLSCDCNPGSPGFNPCLCIKFLYLNFGWNSLRLVRIWLECSDLLRLLPFLADSLRFLPFQVDPLRFLPFCSDSLGMCGGG